MKTITIPTCANPFVIYINGKKYSYPAGTEQEVPDEVALIIEQHYNGHKEKYHPVEAPFSPGNDDNITFTTSAISLSIALDGIGKVKVDFGDGTFTEKLLDGEASFKHRYAGKAATHLVTIEGASNIKLLSAPKCAIENIEFTANSSIEKVVLYDNSISTLDVSMLKALQYLHIFNNPVCSNSTELAKTYAGLPNRNGKAFGSVVMYPFYPLGVLVYKNGSTLTKYPNKAAVAPVEDQLYRDMNAADVKWYKYENAAFVLQTEQNHLINLRIAMEAITLPLGWLFGSAIQYDEAEYAKCDFYFKQNHVQDYWETAERGLGVKIGFWDFIAGQVDGFEHMNVLRYLNADGENTTPRTITGNNGSSLHGDALISTVACRGGKMYGITPDCQLYLIDLVVGGDATEEQYAGRITDLADNSDIVSCSSYPLSSNPANLALYKEIWENFGAKHPLFASAGNAGDGKPWEDDALPNNWDVRFGDAAYCVGGIRQNDMHFVSSQSFADLSWTDMFSQYGDGVLYYDDYLEDCAVKTGTSHAAPICAAVVSLIMCVYKKIYGESESYGKGSDFMRFVTVHSDPIYNEMNRIVGNGKPDLMHYNKLIADDCSVPVAGIEIADVDAVHGEGVDIAPVVTPENADNVAVTYDYDLSRLAIRGNTVYPLIEQESTIEVTAYSNMNEESKATFNVNVPAAVSSASVISETPLPVELTDGKVSLLGNNRAKDYTIQARINFADVDTNTTKKVFDFYTSDGKYNAYLSIEHKSAEASQVMRLVIKRLYTNGAWNDVQVQQLAKAAWFEDLEGKNYVLTFTVKDGTYEVLLNGNAIGGGDLVAVLPLYDWRITADMLVSGTADDVLAYDRVLTYEEIIRNTIAMLNEA